MEQMEEDLQHREEGDNQVGGPQEEKAPEDEDGGHGGENDGHDVDDDIAPEQKDFFEREQARREEAEQEGNQIGQIEIPRDEEEEDDDEEEEQNMGGAQLHAPGKSLKKLEYEEAISQVRKRWKILYICHSNI